MINKDNIVNGYKVLADKVDELYLDLTLRQFQELQTQLDNTWAIIERRKAERRV